MAILLISLVTLTLEIPPLACKLAMAFAKPHGRLALRARELLCGKGSLTRDARHRTEHVIDHGTAAANIP